MAAWELVATDLAGTTTAFLEDAVGLKVTSRINGYRELRAALDPLDEAAAEVIVGKRAIRAYRAGVVQFNGKVWEPLAKGSEQVSLTARGPLAEFVLRRVREQKDYTATGNFGGPWDAGQIAYDRLALQNAIRSTYLGAGTRQASANRVRTAAAGQKEGDVLEELAAASGGFFFKERPVDDVAGSFALLDILYPAAGTNREEVRFGYGEDTLDNLVAYEQQEMLPLNRYLVASSAATGGRIARAAESADSIAEYGLFEEESTFSDAEDATLLQQQADASLKPTPPATYTLTPGLDAPVLFEEFDAGDFVRLHVRHGSVDLFSWVRVIEATVSVSAEGIETLEELKVEALVGDQVSVHPDALFIADRDEGRRRLEALERKVENMSVATVDPGSAPAPTGGGGEAPPPEPAPQEAPPPPAPPEPPEVSLVSANGMWNEGESPSALVTWAVDGKGQSVESWIWLQDGPLDGSGTPTGSIRNAGVHQAGDGQKQEKVRSLLRSHTYYVLLWAQNAAGQVHVGYYPVTTPGVQVG